MASIHPPPRALLGPGRVDADEQNGSRDGTNRHTRVERLHHNYLDRLWMSRVLSVFFAPEFPTLPVSNASYIQSSPYAGISPNLLTASGVDSHSSGRNTSTASTGNRNRGLTDLENVERIGASSQPSAPTKESHEDRKTGLGKALEPMLGDGISASVLLCWGEKHRCHIIPVNIADSTDEVAVWREIHRAWYTYRGHWRRYLPFFGVRQVELVKVCRVAVDRVVYP